MLDTAFILAAGLGTRMRPLTEYTAKPLLHFRGERLIERHLRKLSAAGFQTVLINCSWQGQQLRQLLGDGSTFNISIKYSCEDKAPLETASGIARQTELLTDKPFLLLNGDIWTDIDLKSLRLAQICPQIVLVDNPTHNRAGDFALDTNHQVQNIGGQKLTYAGISIFSTELVKDAALSGEKLGHILRTAADKQQLRGLHHRGEWFDIGHPSALKTP